MHMSALALASEGGFNPLDLSGIGGYFWTLIIFALAAVPMWKMVFGPVTSAMLERDEKAKAAILIAEQAGRDAESAKAAAEVAAGEAQAEATKLLSAARERAETRERDIIDNAKREADAMIESARKSIQVEQDKAIMAIRNEVVDLSLNAASKVLGRNVGSEDDRKLVAELVASQAGGATS